MRPSIEKSSHGVPFSWENQPGTPLREKTIISDVTLTQDTENAIQLPLPPYSTVAPKPAAHGIYIPLPPCAFQPPQKTALTRSDSTEDPFMKAYMECTKSTRRSMSVNYGRKKDLWHKVKRAGLRIGLRLACNSNRHVRDSDIAPVPEQLDSD